MNRKNTFLIQVTLFAIARDLSKHTSNSYQIAIRAERVREDAIPPNLTNAALVFVDYFDRRRRPHNWMAQTAKKL